MKAVIWTKYGTPDVLELRDVEKPTPKDDEVLIKIHATTVTAGDCEMRRLDFPFYLGLPMRLWIGLLRPKANTIMGTELAGEIEAVGKNIRHFKVGDQVYGAAGMSLGTNAQYICLPEQPGDMEGGVAIKPANMSFEEAATVPFGGRDALHFLRKGDIQSGQKILINGAGGSIGTFAVQLAKLMGAEVTAVDSGSKLETLLSIGADQVVDYTKEDFTTRDEVYDVIFDVVGTVKLSRAAGVIREDGTYLLANPTRQLTQALWAKLTSGRKIVMETSSPTIPDLDYLTDLIEDGKLQTVIDRRFPMEAIREAHEYVETGAKLGNLVITINHEG
jgi:NADPH:quinone reductase-like Zn-dependent oxidoreductase